MAYFKRRYTRFGSKKKSSVMYRKKASSYPRKRSAPGSTIKRVVCPDSTSSLKKYNGVRYAVWDLSYLDERDRQLERIRLNGVQDRFMISTDTPLIWRRIVLEGGVGSYPNDQSRKYRALAFASITERAAQTKVFFPGLVSAEFLAVQKVDTTYFRVRCDMHRSIPVGITEVKRWYGLGVDLDYVYGQNTPEKKTVLVVDIIVPQDEAKIWKCTSEAAVYYPVGVTPLSHEVPAAGLAVPPSPEVQMSDAAIDKLARLRSAMAKLGHTMKKGDTVVYRTFDTMIPAELERLATECGIRVEEMKKMVP